MSVKALSLPVMLAFVSTLLFIGNAELCVGNADQTVAAVVPGGMAAVFYSWDAQGFDDMDFFITIAEEPGTDTLFFWAHCFGFQTGSGGYTGIQTRGYTTHPVGHLFLFSIWDAEDGIPGDGATCLTFGGEGEGWSCRLPLEWVEGHKYRLHIASEGHLWWGACVKDLMTDEEHYIGRIKVPDGWGKLKGDSSNFTEYFSQVPACADLDWTIAIFDHPVASSGSSSLPSTPYGPHTFGPCAEYARVECDDSSCIHEINTNPYTNSVFLPIVSNLE